VVLAKYLEKTFTHQLVGKTVLELGAGTGLVGIVASVLGSKRVVLTDLPYALTNTQANVEANRLALKGDVEVSSLDWCVPEEKSFCVPPHTRAVRSRDAPCLGCFRCALTCRTKPVPKLGHIDYILASDVVCAWPPSCNPQPATRGGGAC